MTGTLKGAAQGALWGGITAGVSFGVAEGVSAMTGINAHSASFFNGVNKASITKAIAHGLSRTALSELRYGTTKGAFMSGFISSGFSVGADAEYGAIKMAIIGGTVSELGGGKFANGAMGSAFQYMFNDWIDDMRQKVNENVMRNEAQHEWERKNAEALSASLRKGVVSGLEKTCTISGIYGALAMESGVGAEAGFILIEVSLASKGAAYYLNSRDNLLDVAEVARETAIDIMAPSGFTGVVIGESVKQIINTGAPIK